MNSRSLVYDGSDASAEGYREALRALGSGYPATRGVAAANDADAIHDPGRCLADG